MKKVDIKAQTIIGDKPPNHLRGLGADTLRNLQNVLDPSQLEQLELVDIEYWPVQEVSQELTATQKPGNKTETMDFENKVIISTTEAVEMTAEEIEEKSEAIKQKSRELVVAEMLKRQGSGITFNGMPIATDGNAMAQMIGAKQRSRSWRKVVPRFGRGAKLRLAENEFNALFNAAETYQQAVQDWAYDLIVQIDDGEFPDINSGWPSNEL